MNSSKHNAPLNKFLFNLVILAVLAVILFSCSEEVDYPIKPDALRSGSVKWEESLTPDGWAMVINEDGTTLGYSKSSGLQLI